MSPIIAFDGVYKSFPSTYTRFKGGIKAFLISLARGFGPTEHFDVLNNLTFSVDRGESVALIGRNGVGKSTILSLIAGVITPTKGRVQVHGRVSPLLELGGGFHPDLSGRENIFLNGVLLGLSRQQVNLRLEEIIAFSEIGEFIDQPLRTFSSGMVTRLGFSVVAHLDPEILLVDEVLSVGDVAFQKKCLQKIQDFRRAGVTIVVVSHDARDVETLCDRAIWIDAHHLKMNGKVNDVLREYARALT